MSTPEEEIYQLNQLYLGENDRVYVKQICKIQSTNIVISTSFIILVTDGFICTKEHGHTGQHGSHGLQGQLIATWTDNEQPKLLPSEG